ncbi:MAG: ATP-grasp domain-containing protein, partial [Rubrivivax sp.]|nr:ATP-grasp domain-containing protein [Rubrivivax sp.]
VALASSKSRTLARLAAAGVRTAPTWPLSAAPLDRHADWAVKPDCGCGCEAAHRLTAARAEALRRTGTVQGLIAQPWLSGLAMSLSLRIAGGRTELLSVNRQHIVVAADGALSLNGLTQGIDLPPQADAAALARRVARAIPGLRGFVGVDFIHDAGGRAMVLEVNPRLTSAYVGLSARLGRHLAAEILADFMKAACRA